MKEIIIHIGIPKTGTTYIQHLLRQNIKNLSSSGITYPDIESEHVEISYKEVSWEPSKNGILLLDEDYINNISSEIQANIYEDLFSGEYREESTNRFGVLNTDFPNPFFKSSDIRLSSLIL